MLTTIEIILGLIGFYFIFVIGYILIKKRFYHPIYWKEKKRVYGYVIDDEDKEDYEYK